MLLRFENEDPFAQGRCTYEYRPASEREDTPRIIVPVQIEGIATRAIIDTGGVYLICDPEIAEFLTLDPTESLGTETLGIRGMRYAGNLYRLLLGLMATEGEELQVEVTAFVPQLAISDEWALPSFLGLQGCLERLRFAVDPSHETFYFGPTHIDLQAL